MATILDANRAAKWRAELLPAHFDGRMFYVENGSYEGGRRIASHEYPKKETGYAEDMGRKATAFNVRGYIIVYPHDDVNAPDLYRTDYRIARDALRERLDAGGPGALQLPTFKTVTRIVVCTQFRLTEEERFGGYCVFDMQFLERGVPPFKTVQNSQQNLVNQAEALKLQVMNVWAQQRTPVGR